MANISRPSGLMPIRHLDGSPYNGQVTRYFASASDAAAIFAGDLVQLAAVSDLQGQALLNGVNSTVGGVPGVTVFVPGTSTAAVGVAVGFMVNPLNLNNPQYRLASTAMYVLVSDATDVVYEVQVDGTTPPGGSAGLVGATNFTKNATIATGSGTGNTVTGRSTMVLGLSTIATTATLTLKLTGAEQRVDNDITTANAKVLVYINNHQLAGGTGTAGV